MRAHTTARDTRSPSGSRDAFPENGITRSYTCRGCWISAAAAAAARSRISSRSVSSRALVNGHVVYSHLLRARRGIEIEESSFNSKHAPSSRQAPPSSTMLNREGLRKRGGDETQGDERPRKLRIFRYFGPIMNNG